MKRWIVGFFVFFLAVVSANAFAADSARIAIASEGKTLDFLVSPMAARSPYFLLFDAQGKLVEAMENPHRDASGGAGSRVADLLSKKGITTVVAGAFGPNMINAMRAKKLTPVEFKGKVTEALKEALKK